MFRLAASIVAGAIALSCALFDPTEQMQVSHNPYGEVNWSLDHRLVSQLHDHVAADVERIRAYDSAGYDVVSLMDYSGVETLDYAWRERIWPPDKWLPQALLDSLKSIKFFLPNAEEVGYNHLTSPFLTTYIARRKPLSFLAGPVPPWRYSSTQEAIDLIIQFGGLAIIAHPWREKGVYSNLHGYLGMEIYSAYAAHVKPELNRNEVMLANWDEMLRANPNILGVAVNDHMGPFASSVDLRIRDSGKIVVLSHDDTPGGFRDALVRRAVLAVKDIGFVKNRYPEILSIGVGNAAVVIQCDGNVLWIANGKPLALGNFLAFSSIPNGATYVRAEVTNAEGSTVYTQAFSVGRAGR